jgi:hypothetical protein
MGTVAGVVCQTATNSSYRSVVTRLSTGGNLGSDCSCRGILLSPLRGDSYGESSKKKGRGVHLASGRVSGRSKAGQVQD